MRLYLVRRTRSFIKQNYAKTDTEINRKYLEFTDGERSYFPDRIPKKVEYDFDPDDPNDQYAKLYKPEVVDTINSLNLPRYGLGNFLDEQTKLTATKAEEVIKDNLSRAGKRLMGFCRTNLYKRLESSGWSFLLSISRHILRNYIYIYAIENNLELPVGSQEANMLDEFLDDVDIDDAGEETKIGLILDEEIYLEKSEKIYHLFNINYHSRFSWIRNELFLKSLKNSLINDSRELIKILSLGKDWKPGDDRQLNALYKLCTETYTKDKILIFTQFADTAFYLFEELNKRKLKSLECVTGDNENPTAFAHRFSPGSNDKQEIANTSQEIRVLITTDVLSEGQNLQDGHIVINYDLPWAIIRLIQRAGRIDRIGQKSEQILCYSFLPEDGIERIINLRGRLQNRIVQNAEVVGSDETFFDGDPINIYDLYNEKSGLLDEEDDGEVDLASYAYQIWKNATDADPKLSKIIPDLPNVLYATKKINEKDEYNEGVILYTRTADDNDVLAWLNKKGEIITQSQLTILKVAQCQPNTKPMLKIENHHKLVEQGMEHIKDVETAIGGQLGKKSSVRYRTYMKLDIYCKTNENTMFITAALKKSIDDIYKYPLKEFAREALGRQLKAGISDHDFANLVVSLREEEKLSVASEDEVARKEPQIICSMGFTNKEE